jgi:hypothetical protein
MYIFQMAWLVGDIVMMSAGLILLWYVVVVARRAARGNHLNLRLDWTRKWP